MTAREKIILIRTYCRFDFTELGAIFGLWYIQLFVLYALCMQHAPILCIYMTYCQLNNSFKIYVTQKMIFIQ